VASTTRRVLIAFDKFKGALTAREACDTAAEVIRQQHPDWQLDCAPLSDGGDGFCRILTEAAHGNSEPVLASGPLFEGTEPTRHVQAEIGLVDVARLPRGARQLLRLNDDAVRLAIVEMASVNGLSTIATERRDVWCASSYGTGELLHAASQRGAQAVLLGVGGSATSDLGLGALCALGLRFETAAGMELRPPVPAHWPRVARVRGALGSELLPLRIACDVNNPLLGPNGAASVYGPQKGMKAEDWPRFDREALRMAELLCEQLGLELALTQVPGSGAAGGIAFGLMAAARAELVAGFPLVSHWLDLDARLAQADCVLTGEGRFDASSWAGKGPGALAESASRLGRRCVVFAGSVATEPREPGCEVMAISPPDLPLHAALGNTQQNLARAVESWLDGVDGLR
jgi:glycerate kinase